MPEQLDLQYSEEQQAIADAVQRFCEQNTVEQHTRTAADNFAPELWHALAELGVFTPALPGHTEAGGIVAVCAICEVLGGNVFPGPVPATYSAVQVLQGADLEAVTTGRFLVSLRPEGSDLLPYAEDADIFLAVSGNAIHHLQLTGAIEALDTLAGERWGKASTSVLQACDNSTGALVTGNIATAAYLNGAGFRLLQAASEHAATRKQFGRTLGEFQAVSHPLADCAIELTAARTLARAAASASDAAGTPAADEPSRLAAGALLSATRASLNTAYKCHQAFGAIGVTVEGPAFHISRRVRQLASQAARGLREQELSLARPGSAT